MPAGSCRHPRGKWRPLRNGRLVCGLCGDTMARVQTKTQPGDEPWRTITIRAPRSVATMFESELERCKHARGTSHDHLGLEVMVLNSAHTPPGEM